MHRRKFLALAAQSSFAPLLAFAGCASRSRRSDSAEVFDPALQMFVTELRSQLPTLMVEFKVPGLSVAIIHRAKIAWLSGFGYKDVNTRTPVDTHTIFEAGSMSKPIFAYAALKLCEKGVIGLDTPLAKYAPEPFLTGDSRMELITPRHILSHTGGFQNMRSGSKPLKIHFDPGTQYLYSGEGYYYLQTVITHLTGGGIDRSDCAKFEADLEVCASDIDQFLAANVLTPFGMKASGYIVPPGLQQHQAAGHDSEGNPFPKGKPGRPGMTRYASLGALSCTPSDYAKFMIEILEPKRAENFRLKKETVDEMLKPHIKVVQGPFTSSWGLGWQIQDNGLFNHGGDNKGFHCHSIATRESKSGFIIMTNGDQGAQLIQKVFASKILEGLFPQNA